ncbi:hypothetical protein VTK73DRAFT_4826 [Phialemonium thermophilum]|uniref:Uncharacterized protein n=1 Tax=Phialemonium thermophilum TaxID=223376 RepID=A0ABR3V5R0_9PEZI
MRTIDGLMKSGSYDEAMMRWLQSGADREEAIFDQVIVPYDPRFVAELPPLLLLSVGATVSADLDGPHVAQKLALTEMVIYSFHQMLHSLDDQVREVTPKIMSLLKTRIEHLFARIHRIAPNDPTLKNLTNMANVAGRITDIVRSGGAHHAPY